MYVLPEQHSIYHIDIFMIIWPGIPRGSGPVRYHYCWWPLAQHADCYMYWIWNKLGGYQWSDSDYQSCILYECAIYIWNCSTLKGTPRLPHELWVVVCKPALCSIIFSVQLYVISCYVGQLDVGIHLYCGSLSILPIFLTWPAVNIAVNKIDI